MMYNTTTDTPDLPWLAIEQRGQELWLVRPDDPDTAERLVRGGWQQLGQCNHEGIIYEAFCHEAERPAPLAI